MKNIIILREVFKKSIVYVIGVSEEEKECDAEKECEEIMAENFPKLEKYINLQIQEAQ